VQQDTKALQDGLELADLPDGQDRLAHQDCMDHVEMEALSAQQVYTTVAYAQNIFVILWLYVKAFNGKLAFVRNIQNKIQIQIY